MKKKTKIIIGCAVLALVIIAAAITGIKITDLQRQNTFVDQVNKLSQIVDAEYISDIDRDEFNTFIDSRVCKGKYAKLENAVKSYYKDLYEIQFKSEDAITNSAYDKMLLSDNLLSDGPDFENSRAELATLLQTLQDCSAQYSELITAEKAKSYFDETKLSAKYETLFNDSVSVAASETENIYLTSLENSEKSVSAVSGVIDYLAQTKNEWSVEGDKLKNTTRPFRRSAMRKATNKAQNHKRTLQILQCAFFCRQIPKIKFQKRY